MNILLIGAPGAGKGTQAKKLVAKKNLIHLSTGDLFRKNLKDKTSLGKKAQIYIDKGHLVPDEITNNMVNGFLKSLDPAQGIIFDGFPRNLSQAEALDQMLEKINHKLDMVIDFKIPDDVVVARLTGRLWAPKSGRIYHIKNKPPKQAGICDESGETLVVRPDDQAKVIRSRLEVFHKNTMSLCNRYKNKGLLKSVLAELAPEKLFAQILQILGKVE